MENNTDKIGSGEVQFNLGATQLMIIGNLMERASNEWLEGHLDKSFWALKQIKGLIISRLNDRERKDLEHTEQLFGMARARSRNLSSVSNQVYETYRDKIMILLESKGFLVPLKQDKSLIFGQGD